jgi:hypothetical protein
MSIQFLPHFPTFVKKSLCRLLNLLEFTTGLGYDKLLMFLDSCSSEEVR